MVQLEQIEMKNKLLQAKLKQNKGNSKSQPNNKDACSNNQWIWKEIAPKENEKHTKVFDGKTYHWCQLHNVG